MNSGFVAVINQHDVEIPLSSAPWNNANTKRPPVDLEDPNDRWSKPVLGRLEGSWEDGEYLFLHDVIIYDHVQDIWTDQDMADPLSSVWFWMYIPQ